MRREPPERRAASILIRRFQSEATGELRHRVLRLERSLDLREEPFPLRFRGQSQQRSNEFRRSRATVVHHCQRNGLRHGEGGGFGLPTSVRQARRSQYELPASLRFIREVCSKDGATHRRTTAR